MNRRSAEIVVVGSELLDGAGADTNSGWLGAELGRLGLPVRGIAVVPDDAERIAAAIAAALGRAGAVLVTGGLGPTADDRTREGVASALGVPLEREARMEEEIRRRIAGRGRVADAADLRQADRPHGSTWIENPVGIAPGIATTAAGALLFVLPGVPAELQAMFAAAVAPAIAGLDAGTYRRRVVHVAGRAESAVDRALGGLYAGAPGEVTLLAKASGVEVVLRARGSTPAAAAARLDGIEREVRQRLGEDVVGADDDSLAVVIGGLLRRRGATLSVAESCTAGMVAATITTVPGASAWFRGGVVAYANELKTALVGVPGAAIAVHGAVSEPVALALASGVRDVCGSDWGIGVTGVAGPDGGTDEKPVGSVWIAVAGPDGARAQRAHLPGERDQVRRRAVTFALDALRRALLRSR